MTDFSAFDEARADIAPDLTSDGAGYLARYNGELRCNSSRADWLAGWDRADREIKAELAEASAILGGPITEPIEHNGGYLPGVTPRAIDGASVEKTEAVAEFRGYLDADLRAAGLCPSTDDEAAKAYQQSLVSDQVCWIVAEREIARLRSAAHVDGRNIIRGELDIVRLPDGRTLAEVLAENERLRAFVATVRGALP